MNQETLLPEYGGYTPRTFKKQLFGDERQSRLRLQSNPRPEIRTLSRQQSSTPPERGKIGQKITASHSWRINDRNSLLDDKFVS
jgi:hypothetical protein